MRRNQNFEEICSEFSLNFLSIFVYISSSNGLITLIWVSLERSFPPAEVGYRWCQFWSKVMTSEAEERPRRVTAGYGQHRSQWVKNKNKKLTISTEITFTIYEWIVYRNKNVSIKSEQLFLYNRLSWSFDLAVSFDLHTRNKLVAWLVNCINYSLVHP